MAVAFNNMQKEDGPAAVVADEPQRNGRSSWIVRTAGQNLALPWQDYLPILLALSWAAASVDVFSLPSLRIFVANNTGNLVLLSLALGQLEPIYPELVRPVPCVASLICSWLGSYTSGVLGRRYGPRHRTYLFCEYLEQSVIGFLCAGLYYGGYLSYLDGRTEYVTICLMSFAMGQQNVSVSALKTGGTVATTVATGAMATFFSDPKLFVLHNRARNERFIFVLTFFFGGAIAALAYRYSRPELSLLMSAILKLIAAVGFLIARPQKPKTMPS